MHTPFPPVAVGREWDTFECAGVETSPSTRFRSATIIYNVLAELPKEGVGYAHSSFIGRHCQGLQRHNLNHFKAARSPLGFSGFKSLRLKLSNNKT
ncbi:hypothetical protein MCL36_00145 [Acinetobacter pittii]|uniref:hypothetical protein n=1 Tax=Acinetobacter pittii TaxID=48296 RepID=UPI001EFE0C30|nr:hypothetical protein [Acinetobacter pittii]MCG9490949.1 hypothetical protein [Acinetobacter pittii]